MPKIATDISVKDLRPNQYVPIFFDQKRFIKDLATENPVSVFAMPSVPLKITLIIVF